MGITFYEPAGIPENEKERERAVQASGILRLSGDPIILALTVEARRQFMTAQAAVSVVYQDSHFLIAADGLLAGPYSRKTSLGGHVIHQPRRLFWISDARIDPRFSNNPAVEDHAVAFYAAAPLINAEAFALGAFFIFDPKPRGEPSEGDKLRLFNFAQRAMERVEEAKRRS